MNDQNLYPFSDLNGSKSILFGTHIPIPIDIGEYSPGEIMCQSVINFLRELNFSGELSVKR